MTKEQIFEAIAEATGSTPTPVDEAFISKFKEQNAQNTFKLWVGTEAQYNAIQTKATDTIYIKRPAGTAVALEDISIFANALAQKAEIEHSHEVADIRNITISANEPTGGDNGDVWLKYEA